MPAKHFIYILIVNKILYLYFYIWVDQDLWELSQSLQVSDWLIHIHRDLHMFFVAIAHLESLTLPLHKVSQHILLCSACLSVSTNWTLVIVIVGLNAVVSELMKTLPRTHNNSHISQWSDYKQEFQMQLERQNVLEEHYTLSKLTITPWSYIT